MHSLYTVYSNSKQNRNEKKKTKKKKTQKKNKKQRLSYMHDQYNYK